eukprot:3613288-Alexandrium_andersonii.AAC.1
MHAQGGFGRLWLKGETALAFRASLMLSWPGGAVLVLRVLASTSKPPSFAKSLLGACGRLLAGIRRGSFLT